MNDNCSQPQAQVCEHSSAAVAAISAKPAPCPKCNGAGFVFKDSGPIAFRKTQCSCRRTVGGVDRV